MTSRELKDYYLTTEFRNAYHYDGELGVILTDEGTEIRLWSPLSEKVTIHFYEEGEGDNLLHSYEMRNIGKGVWSYREDKNLSGLYYDFLIESKLGKVASADPYAKACGVNGIRSMILDLKKTNPEGWEEDISPKREMEDIIYELHVREFSHDEAGGFSEENRGKYKAFQEDGTSLNGKGEVPTGLEYIKMLGVNHVQLLPIFDFASVDERGGEEFNWGYDPLNYNVPEGSYASSAEKGEVRVRECKEMIQGLHKKGLRVIMDVVYNHTFSLDSWFQKTAPWYFYRVDESGIIADGSACGNDFATEMEMAGKYILDSVLYWAREYHIDGFRFDLMGLINVRLMNRIRKALDEEFGVGEKLIYGEPWAADTTFVEQDEALAVKKNIHCLDNGIGIFSDDIRDGVKGSVFYEEAKGFVNGNTSFTDNIVHAIRGFRGEKRPKKIKNATNKVGESEIPEYKSPNQIINYISCHDNQTLWDKLTKTTKEEERRKKEYRLAAATYLFSQGRCFIYSGEEFLRTKGGEHNSYKSPIQVNKLDWKLIEENKDMVDYYRGLIALRKEFTGLSDKSDEAYKNIRFLKVEDGFIAFEVENREREGFVPKWEKVVILLNATEERKHSYLRDGEFEVLSDGMNSFKWMSGEKRIMEKDVEVPPLTACVLGFIKKKGKIHIM